MLPTDFAVEHAVAMALLLLSWVSYASILSILGKGTLNSQLMVVRRRWLKTMTARSGKPFDAVLMGHIVHAVSFFGSATLIVVAGLFASMGSIGSVYETAIDLHFVSNTSIELFTIVYAFVTLTLLICFLSFIYSIRKLIYTIALMGALPEQDAQFEGQDQLIAHASTVLTEALTTFNFGFRGFYYTIAAMFLFVSPAACIVASLFVTALLVYRQLYTRTSRAIQGYVEILQGKENSVD